MIQSRLLRSKTEDRANLEDPATPLSGENLASVFGYGVKTRSGERIGPSQAMTVAPVWQALELLGGTISRIPFCVHNLTHDEKDRPLVSEAFKHPVYKLLRRRADGLRTTSNIWLQRMINHAALYGNAFSLIRMRRDERGISRPDRLVWIHSDNVQVDYRNGRKVFLVQLDQDLHGSGDLRTMADHEVFHLQGLTMTDHGGLSLIAYARQMLGRHKAAEGYGDDFFSNDATPSGWFEHPGEMGDEAHARFLASVQERHAGPGNRHLMGILEEGLKWKSAGASPADALLIDQLKMGIKQTASFFNVPPSKLGDESAQNYNNTEAENKSFYNNTLATWTSRLEFEANNKLFTEAEIEDGSAYAAFKPAEMFRADSKERFASYAVAINWGMMTRNEVRALENLNPIDGGDEILTPVNMAIGEDGTPVNTTGAGDGPPESGEDRDASRVVAAATDAARLAFAAQAERMAKRLANAANKAARKPASFIGFVNSLEEQHAAAVSGGVSRAADVLKTLGGKTTADGFANYLLATARNLFLTAATDEETLSGSIAAACEDLLRMANDYQIQFEGDSE